MRRRCTPNRRSLTAVAGLVSLTVDKESTGAWIGYTFNVQIDGIGK